MFIFTASCHPHVTLAVIVSYTRLHDIISLYLHIKQVKWQITTSASVPCHLLCKVNDTKLIHAQHVTFRAQIAYLHAVRFSTCFCVPHHVNLQHCRFCPRVTSFRQKSMTYSYRQHQVMCFVTIA